MNPDPDSDPDFFGENGSGIMNKYKKILKLNIYFFLIKNFWIRVRISNPDPDPQTQLNPDPVGFGSETLTFWVPVIAGPTHPYEAALERWRIQVGVLSLSSQRGRCRTTRLQDYCVQEYRLSCPTSSKCNVLRKSLSEGSQNIPCATLKRRGSWVISIYL
jgi:hypothetical protein